MTHKNLDRLEDLDPVFQEKVIELLADLADQEMWVCVVSGNRSIQQQNTLYEQGRSLAGEIVTNAKGGQSAHNFGMAVDLAPLDENGKIDWFDNKGFQIIGDTAVKHNLTWGGNFKSFKDKPHVESPAWKEVQALWRAGKITVA